MAAAALVQVRRLVISTHSRNTYSENRLLVWGCFVLILGLSQPVEGSDLCDQFHRCFCNETSIVCVDQKLPNISLLLQHYKGDTTNVTNITLVGNNFEELPKNLFGSCDIKQWPSLKYLDLSNNAIREVHGKTFHCIHELEILRLEDNQWRVNLHSDRTGYFTSLPKLKTLDLSNAFQERWNGSVHLVKLEYVFNNTDMKSLQELNMASNEFLSFSAHTGASLCRLTSLRRLNLSDNFLSDPYIGTGSKTCLSELEELDLSNNNLYTLSSRLMSTLDNMASLKTVHFESNPFECSCGLIETYKWLKTSPLVPAASRKNMICTDGYDHSYIGKNIFDLKIEDLKCFQPAPPSKAASVVIGIIFAVIIIALLAFLTIHRRKVIEFCSRQKKRLPTISGNSHAGYSTVENV